MDFQFEFCNNTEVHFKKLSKHKTITCKLYSKLDLSSENEEKRHSTLSAAHYYPWESQRIGTKHYYRYTPWMFENKLKLNENKNNVLWFCLRIRRRSSFLFHFPLVMRRSCQRTPFEIWGWFSTLILLWNCMSRRCADLLTISFIGSVVWENVLMMSPVHFWFFRLFFPIWTMATRYCMISLSICLIVCNKFRTQQSDWLCVLVGMCQLLGISKHFIGYQFATELNLR